MGVTSISTASGVSGGGQSDVRWQGVCNRFRKEFGDHAYASWLDQLVFLGVEGHTVNLGAPTRFVRDWIQRHYATRLKDFLLAEDADLHDMAIRLLKVEAQDDFDHDLDGDGCGAQGHGRDSHRPSGQAVPANHNMKDPADTLGLDPRYTFDSFVVGKPNEFAYHAAKRIASQEDVPFNPLFLYGDVGLGKTHLMHAIAWELSQNRPDLKVVYISAEKFMFELISAIRYKDTHTFKNKYRNVDVFMVDDVQFIANKDSTQEEFFHTFNALIENRCQVVITADRSPTDLEGIQQRIISRLGWGLVADIHPTNFELRLSILQAKAEQSHGIAVPVEVLEFLAKRITSNVRELEGAFNRVMAYATLVGRPISIDMTRDVLQDLIRANDRKVTIDEIQRTVADYYNIRLSEMLSQRRSRNIARPRQVAMYLAKTMTPRSLPEIGRHFGKRDHTTVMHAVKKIEDLRRDDSVLEDDLARLTRQIEG